jgi:CheY-like chemotaxis protein
MAKPEKVYCISCGEDVPVEIVSIGIEGEDLLRCSHCGAYLGTTRQPQTLAEPAPPPPKPMIQEPVPGPDFSPDESSVGVTLLPEIPRGYEAQEPEEDLKDIHLEKDEPESEAGVPPLEVILIAEDSELLRRMLGDMLVEKGLTSNVATSKNGFEAVSTYVRQRNDNTRLGLVILDVKMPVLNGIAAAVALRSFEKGMGISPVPILFFTSKRCDATFRKAISYCRPAMYVNKGASQSAAHLQDRVSKVIDQLLQQEW